MIHKYSVVYIHIVYTSRSKQNTLNDVIQSDLNFIIHTNNIIIIIGLVP